jgi:hypothetical protein
MFGSYCFRNLSSDLPAFVLLLDCTDLILCVHLRPPASTVLQFPLYCPAVSSRRQDKVALIPDPIVARKRYSVSLRTLDRWDRNKKLGFPPPRYINGRKYRDDIELDEFDRASTRRLAAEPNNSSDAPAT